MALRAVIYLPAAVEVARWLPVCLAHCERHAYIVASVILPNVSGWAAVVDLLTGGEVDVVVVGSYDHLPPDRVPRIEEAVEDRPSGRPAQRRPRRR